MASPELCMRVKVDLHILCDRYDLTERESKRLVGLVNHLGMKCNCMLYRANRLAPLALNLPRLCRALDDDLRNLASEYWAAYPNTDVHFLVESQRFCDFVRQKLAEQPSLGHDVRTALDQESAALAVRLRISRTNEPLIPAPPEMPRPVPPPQAQHLLNLSSGKWQTRLSDLVASGGTRPAEALSPPRESGESQRPEQTAVILMDETATSKRPHLLRHG